MKKIAWMGLLISLIFTLMSPGSSSYFSDVEASRGNTLTAGVWDNPGIEPDTTPPVITLIGDETVNLKVDDTYEDAGATATDDVDGDITENIVVVNPVDVNAADTYIITYNVSDVAGNPATEVTRTVIVSEEPDTTPPTLTEVTPVSTLTNDNTPDYTFNSDEVGTITYAGGCTSATTDAVVGDNTITFDALADGIYDNCTITVTDESDNASDPLLISPFTIDTVIPVITLLGEDPVNLYVGASYEDAGATALDDVDGDITANIITVNPVDTSTAGTYTITYNATDTAGNSAEEVTRTVVVSEEPEPESDTTPPVITLSGDATVNLTVGDPYTDAGATAIDDVDGDITANIVVGGDAVDTNVVGTYIITYNVSDTAGNPATEVTRTVIVSEEPDTTPPTLTEVIPVSTLTNDNTPDYTFNSDEAGTIAYAGGCTSATTEALADNNTVTFDTLADGIYDSCTIIVTDAAGNPSTALNVSAFTIDTTPPVITLIGDETVNLTVGDIYEDAGATAIDDIDTAVTVATGGDTVNTAVSGTYTITYNATDTAGNSAEEVTRTVIVSEATDSTPPVITLLGEDPVNLYIGDTYEDAGATAIDDVDGDITANIVVGGDTVDTTTVGTYTITYNVSDTAGNPATEVTRTVTVIEEPEP